MTIHPAAAARELLRGVASSAGATTSRPTRAPPPTPEQASSILAAYGRASRDSPTAGRKRGEARGDALLGDGAAAQYASTCQAVRGAASAQDVRRTCRYPTLLAWTGGAKAWWIPQGVAWNDKDKRFTFPSGATVTFGYLDTERDRYRYQGAELQFVAFDELTQFPKAWYIYLLSRLRRMQGSEVPLRVRSASNGTRRRRVMTLGQAAVHG